jgi:hypothetical protein
MNRELSDEPPPGPERRRSHRPHRTPRRGVRVGTAAWYLLITAFIAFMLLMLLTDIWPFGHEMIIQHTWKPVCDYGHGRLEFCKP